MKNATILQNVKLPFPFDTSMCPLLFVNPICYKVSSPDALTYVFFTLHLITIYNFVTNYWSPLPQTLQQVSSIIKSFKIIMQNNKRLMH